MTRQVKLTAYLGSGQTRPVTIDAEDVVAIEHNACGCTVYLHNGSEITVADTLVDVETLLMEGVTQ